PSFSFLRCSERANLLSISSLTHSVNLVSIHSGTHSPHPARIAFAVMDCITWYNIPAPRTPKTTPGEPKTLSNKRSEERRVGKECRSRWSPTDEKKKEKEGGRVRVRRTTKQ